MLIKSGLHLVRGFELRIQNGTEKKGEKNKYRVSKSWDERTTQEGKK